MGTTCTLVAHPGSSSLRPVTRRQGDACASEFLRRTTDAQVVMAEGHLQRLYFPRVAVNAAGTGVITTCSMERSRLLRGLFVDMTTTRTTTQ